MLSGEKINKNQMILCFVSQPGQFFADKTEKNSYFRLVHKFKIKSIVFLIKRGAES
jgi:hypothetical protein